MQQIEAAIGEHHSARTAGFAAHELISSSRETMRPIRSVTHAFQCGNQLQNLTRASAPRLDRLANRRRRSPRHAANLCSGILHTWFRSRVSLSPWDKSLHSIGILVDAAGRSRGSKRMSHAAQIAIVGGGPSGALCAERLARAGFDVTLYDEHLAWEKPCGGGLTHKAMRRLSVSA